MYLNLRFITFRTIGRIITLLQQANLIYVTNTATILSDT